MDREMSSNIKMILPSSRLLTLKTNGERINRRVEVTMADSNISERLNDHERERKWKEFESSYQNGEEG